MSKQSKIVKRVGWIISCINNIRGRDDVENEPDLLRLSVAVKQWCVDNTDEKTTQEILKMKWNNPVDMCFSNIQFYFNDLPDIIKLRSGHLTHAQHEYVKFGKTVIFNGEPVTKLGLGRMLDISTYLCYFNVEKNISKLISEYDGGCCTCILHSREVKIPYFDLYKSETCNKYVECGKYIPHPEEKLVSKKIAVTDIKHEKGTIIIFSSSCNIIKTTIDYLELTDCDVDTNYFIYRTNGVLECSYTDTDILPPLF